MPPNQNPNGQIPVVQFPPPLTYGHIPNQGDVLYPTQVPVVRDAGGGIAQRLFKKVEKQIKKLEPSNGEVCCPPILAPNAKQDSGPGAVKVPTYGQFIFPSDATNVTFDFLAFNVDPAATFAVFPLGGTLTIVNTTITPGVEPAPDEVDLDLDLTALPANEDALVVITNPCGCAASIQVIKEDEA